MSSLELFSGLSDAELELVRGIGRKVTIESGREIFKLGEEATTLFLIEQGKVALTLPLAIRDVVRDVTLEEKEAGAAIGWSALVPPFKLTLNARATSDVVLLGLDRAPLAEVFECNQRIHLVTATNLCQLIAGRLALLEAIVLRGLQRWVTDRFD